MSRGEVEKEHREVGHKKACMVRRRVQGQKMRAGR